MTLMQPADPMAEEAEVHVMPAAWRVFPLSISEDSNFFREDHVLSFQALTRGSNRWGHLPLQDKIDVGSEQGDEATY
ncbi:unnamed protein product [Toxocara canis]|uniref:SKICH domain-containing protein n=1 Tax=Toxocara canis TaxID=6265 RepID=A0A183V5J1_TOXCA|nr:unnamed protein product [Toxocara canis]